MVSRRKQKEDKRQKKRKQRQAARRGRAKGQQDGRCVDLSVRHSRLAFPPVYINSTGTRLPDPHEVLGLDPQEPQTADVVLAAFRKALALVSPEADPQRAQQLVEARDYLLDPEHSLMRILGDLRVPDPAHFVPGYKPGAVQAPSLEAVQPPDWTSHTRLVALNTLFAMLEDELDGSSDRAGETGRLFD